MLIGVTPIENSSDLQITTNQPINFCKKVLTCENHLVYLNPNQNQWSDGSSRFFKTPGNRRDNTSRDGILGSGRFVDQFISWQIDQLRLFVCWYRGETQIKGLNFEISNINYFFLLFFLISSFFSYVELTIREVPITAYLIFISVTTTIVLYFLFLKVLLPVLEFVIGCYIILLSILNTKGILAIVGILIALTGFVISQIASSQTPALTK